MLLTMKDKNRIEVIMAVMDGKIDVKDAVRILNRCERQVYRMLASVRQEGIKGLIHKNRGRESLRRIKDKVGDQIISLVKKKYEGINDTHLREILKRDEGIEIGQESLRKMLRGAGIAPKRKRRRSKYRKRRERKEAFGMMLQIDASCHDWLEGRGPILTLVGAKDDATGYFWARFVSKAPSGYCF